MLANCAGHLKSTVLSLQLTLKAANSGENGLETGEYGRASPFSVVLRGPQLPTGLATLPLHHVQALLFGVQVC